MEEKTLLNSTQTLSRSHHSCSQFSNVFFSPHNLFLFMAEIGRQDSPFSVKNGCRRPPKALPPRSTFQLAYLLPSSYTHHAACSHVGHG
ncbi:hypothetical protein NC653_010045 [Populus alba x Populus x berolinensis]|uniref:Uncharacterized protein n=1 Tax=Populus alba x Populus x berolinensis TaxID=444605 RepID=A0AAD6W4U3_9ROSI|nr:hypothetical protein NC653_010045 [Populus alba x Populus x berolinensis]